MTRRNEGGGRGMHAAKVTLLAAMIAVCGAATTDTSAHAGWNWLKKRSAEKQERRSKRRALFRKQSGRKTRKSSKTTTSSTARRATVSSRAASGRSHSRALQVGVFGDSLGDGMYVGLTQLTSANGRVKVNKFSRMNTGLTRRDRYDWNRAAQKLARQKLHAAVLVFGANDTNPIREKGRTYEFRTPGWEKLYIQRATRIVRTFRQRRIRTYVVGLPITRADRFQSDYAYLNKIFRRVAAKNGARYIDNWKTFADRRGRFTPFYNVDGRQQRIRAQDGVHFTMQGYRYYAQNTHRRLKRDLRF